MKITVILCTYNRCASLADSLHSVAASVVPADVDWEILVVDNNSKDQTRDVIEGFCRQYPGRFRYVSETRQGLSNARNAGIREARGDVLAFVDDDVLVDPAWLHNLTSAMEDSRWAGAGGRIRPEQGFSPPAWLNLDYQEFYLGGSLVLFDLGDQAGQLPSPPFGTNMAFRKTMFEKYGGFRADLGRCGDSLIGNEETEFANRLLSGGERLWYAPSAIVYHPVPKQRLTKSYLRNWWYSYGRSIVRQSSKGPSVHQIPGFYLRRLRGGLRWMFFSNPDWPLYPDWRFYGQVQVCMAAGEILELLRLYRRGAPKSDVRPQANSALETPS
jgi:glycosyltransferase involved in cell wall biosynthesis